MRKRQPLGVRGEPQIRCPSHLAWVRRHECCIAGRNGHVCEGRIEAMHARNGTDGGMGVKPSDIWTIPGCSGAHHEQHQIGEPAFERKYRLSLREIAALLWQKSPHRLKAGRDRETL